MRGQACVPIFTYVFILLGLLGVSHKTSLIFYSDGSMRHACNFYTTAYVLWETETPAFYLGIYKVSLSVFLSLTPTNLAVKEEVSLSMATL